MLIDFHYYAVYTLGRLAGMKHEYIKKIAYASQHTDDAKYDHELYFKSGGRYKQNRSAHSCLDLKFFTKEAGYDIFLPFHFLPGAEGTEFYDRLICKRNSLTSQRILEDALININKPYGIHRLGIALHVYADTWSHQNFHGLQKFHNEVTEYAYINKKNSFFEQRFASLIPPIGHTQVLLSADETSLVWSYKGYNMEKSIVVSNLERAMDAAYHIYTFFVDKVYKQFPEGFEREATQWDKINGKFEEMFSYMGSKDECVENWCGCLQKGFFGFISNTKYDDREWFKAAVEVSMFNNVEIYDKKIGFEKSDWKYFHDAMTYHSFFVKNELLPQFGIIT